MYINRKFSGTQHILWHRYLHVYHEWPVMNSQAFEGWLWPSHYDFEQFAITWLLSNHYKGELFREPHSLRGFTNGHSICWGVQETPLIQWILSLLGSCLQEKATRWCHQLLPCRVFAPCSPETGAEVFWASMWHHHELAHLLGYDHSRNTVLRAGLGKM